MVPTSQSHKSLLSFIIILETLFRNAHSLIFMFMWCKTWLLLTWWIRDWISLQLFSELRGLTELIKMIFSQNKPLKDVKYIKQANNPSHAGFVLRSMSASNGFYFGKTCQRRRGGCEVLPDEPPAAQSRKFIRCFQFNSPICMKNRDGWKHEKPNGTEPSGCCHHMLYYCMSTKTRCSVRGNRKREDCKMKIM